MSNIEKNEVVHGVSLAGERDIHLFREGSHDMLYQFLGAHLIEHKGVSVVEGSLAEGDLVVVEGQVRLAPGLPVKVVE